MLGPKPKGPAEAVGRWKSLGGVLRTFQPTLRELQEVSQEFETVLELARGHLW